MSVIHVGTAEEMDRYTAHAVAAGHGFAAELFAAARRAEINVAYVLEPRTPAPMKTLKRSALPVLAIIGADPGDEGTRPTEWLALRRLADWATFGIVHGSGGTVENYKLAVELARLHRRVLMIECTSARAQEWGMALLRHRPRPVPCVAILPTDGAHPVAPKSATAQ
jgi:hypothetical protein